MKFQPGDAAWNGAQYVGGEFGTLQNTSNLAVATFDRSVRRAYRNELTVGVDHELLPDVLLSVAYLRTREKDVTGRSIRTSSRGHRCSRRPRCDPGRDGIANTGDDAADHRVQPEHHGRGDVAAQRQ